MDERDGTITDLLAKYREGDFEGKARLVDAVYPELERLARHHMQREAPAHTWEPRELVHEIFIKLEGQRKASFANRRHFYALASELMRRALVDYARARRAHKRGSGQRPVTIPLDGVADGGPSTDVLALHEALTRMAKNDPRQARIVELKVFTGLREPEIAEILGVSSSTIRREWRHARASLYRDIQTSS